ncbi:uncharacterized protein [Drosophila pseudoobscura]|uniref:Cyclic nucleotide-binding domain-containing protein n=1 Tax=Drosophila pseudoobscura pseudoobscura TaxID=46245 RepID=A0A6I8VIC6_DROPS|nr:uncharacterized protein LOC4814826 [Drosophila pseudoobscura]XP_015041977.2 uncharacterized protein LOC4814826 [Drosophila pseudoobscura]
MSKRQRDNPDVSVRKAAKARFKQLVRSVILNMQWLSDATEETGLSLNVKKNVAMLVRQKRKIGMMTMAEKSLLRMPHSTRTVEERKKLCTIVANLACFSRFNPKLRARLVPYLKFIALTPGRHVMKEGDFPITIYFIITGEVEVSKMFFNKVTKQYESISEAIFGPGDCIGDIDVMEDAPRTNTYTATTNCELLALYDSDYTTLVQPYMKKLWEEKKEGIRALDYFKFFTPDQVVSACKFATIQQFDPLDTIYEEDLGSLSVVYFVLSGECVVLQCLHMRVSFLGNEKRFELDSVQRNASSGNLDMEHTKNFDFTEYLLSTSTSEQEKKDKKKAMRKMGLKEIEEACGLMARRPVPISPEPERKVFRKTRYTVFKGPVDDYENYVMDEDAEESQELQSPSANSEYSSSDESYRTPSPPVVDSESESDSEGLEIFTASMESKHSEVAPVPSPEKREKYETHFIDVGSLTFGAIFGLGEKMHHRNIMARTTVQCLIIPRFWLFEPAQNPGNIWQRQLLYIQSNLPTREELFNDFLKTRKWQMFRHNYVQKVLTEKANYCDTKPEDVPIVGRIVESTEYS